MENTRIGWMNRWTHRVLAGCLGLMLLVMPTGLMGAWAPEPDPVPTRWELNFEPGPLRVIRLHARGSGPRDYFYMTYRVTNYSGNDLIFAPSFDLVTQEGAIRRSGRDVPAEVTAEILSMLRNPLLEDQISILGNILQGIENAKDGLVIWPADDLETDSIEVYVAGLSGENKPYVVLDAQTGRNKRVMLRKTLMLKYETPGTLANRGSTPLELAQTQWVMR
ncbi:MAG: hypothetical protein DYG94_00600 [Leptolyngbya sp. PLA3]|nr:MAG: hypothetical protein EDM82_01275 [Cyanobacteria bacterium CYA]MCE7967233.1 hypothetical protein [Leptolyngbya sp. PL-A3]